MTDDERAHVVIELRRLAYLIESGGDRVEVEGEIVTEWDHEKPRGGATPRKPAPRRLASVTTRVSLSVVERGREGGS